MLSGSRIPADKRNPPAQAIIAALSVQNSIGGEINCIFFLKNILLTTKKGRYLIHAMKMGDFQLYKLL